MILTKHVQTGMESPGVVVVVDVVVVVVVDLRVDDDVEVGVRR